jgi:predicted AAA+ superfamily ATPase
MIFRIPVLANNPDREIVKVKKLYFCDNGILNALENVSGGVKFENAVFSQLRHHGELAYYALKTGREIDFILDKKIALEVKETPVDTDSSALSKLAKRAGLKTARLIGRSAAPHFTDYIWAGDIR